MKTKHLFYSLALSAAFAACSQEEIVSQQGAVKTDLEDRPVVGNVTLDFGGTESRGTTGDRAFNDIAFVEGEDGFGARIIDVYKPFLVPAGYTLDHAWRNYEIKNDFASSNYKYVNDGGAKWITDALMVEGNYMFYYPYNEANLARTPNKVVLPMTQVVKPNEADGYRNPIKDLYEGENPAIVGYAFLSATDQDATVRPELHHVFAYPEFTLVNEQTTRENRVNVGVDLTIEKILVKSSKFVKNYTINHTGIDASLRDFALAQQKLTNGNEWAAAKTAGTWTKEASLLKNAKTTDIATANPNANVDGVIEVLFEDGLTLAYGEEYTFNLVMPADVYDDATNLSFSIYLSNDKMISGDQHVDPNNYKVLTYAPSKRYPTEEYNFPTNGEPSTKDSKGTLGRITLKNESIVDAVVPAQIIDDVEEFEAYLASIVDNSGDLEEIQEITTNMLPNQFVLARNAQGVANMKIDATVVELVKKYMSEGSVEFLSTMEIVGGEETVELSQMIFDNVCFKAGNVTVNELEAEASEICGDAIVTIPADAEVSMGDITVKDGELIVKKNGFLGASAHKVNVTKTLNSSNQVIATGKLTIDAENNNFNGLTMDAGEVVINEEAVALIGGSANVTAGKITVDGKLQVWSEYTVAENVTLELNGEVEYVNTGAISNEGTINTAISLDVNTNNGIITPNAKTLKVVVAAGNGEIDNTELAKVTANAEQTVYAEISSINGLRNVDAVSGVNRIVVTGDWNITSASQETLHGQTPSVKFNTIEFKGGDLNIESGVTFDMNNASVIINAATEWTGRDANASFIIGINGEIDVKNDSEGKEYDFDIVDLTIADVVITADAFATSINSTTGNVVALHGEVKLTSNLTISKDVTIKGGTISGASVYVNKDNKVAFDGVTFKNATNSANNASSIYFNEATKDITVLNCTFEGFEWDAIKLYNVANNITVNIKGNTFKTPTAEKAKINGSYIHIANETAKTNAVIEISGNTFETAAVMQDNPIKIYGVEKYGYITVGKNQVADNYDATRPYVFVCRDTNYSAATGEDVLNTKGLYDKFIANSLATLSKND